MTHAGKKACHWCEQIFEDAPGINRVVYGCYRRFLPLNHSWRRSGMVFNSDELRPEPTPRTNASIHADGLAADEHKGYAKTNPVHRTGVKSVCPLYYVPLFDMAWDIMGDFMHVTKNYIYKTVNQLKGFRVPSLPKLTSAKKDDKKAKERKLR